MSLPQIMKEWENIKIAKKDGESAFGMNQTNDLSCWTGWLRGPKDSPYENGLFRVEITFPNSYPLKPPRMRFVASILHPNIDTKGDICKI